MTAKSVVISTVGALILVALFAGRRLPLRDPSLRLLALAQVDWRIALAVAAAGLAAWGIQKRRDSGFGTPDSG